MSGKQLIYIDDYKFHEKKSNYSTYREKLDNKDYEYIMYSLCALSETQVIGIQFFKGLNNDSNLGAFIINVVNFNENIK